MSSVEPCVPFYQCPPESTTIRGNSRNDVHCAFCGGDIWNCVHQFNNWFKRRQFSHMERRKLKRRLVKSVADRRPIVGLNLDQLVTYLVKKWEGGFLSVLNATLSGKGGPLKNLRGAVGDWLNV
nr:hypothetical protein [Salmonid herpesvirus 1]